MLAQFDPAILQAVLRTSRRSSAVVHEDLKGGVYDLATIACIAPWFGIFGTIVGIVNSFQGISGGKWTIIAAICRGLSRAMWFTALGLAVGLLALWTYECLSTKLRALDLEMETASLELLNQLSRFPRRFEIGPATTRKTGDAIFGELPRGDVQREERSFRRCYWLAGVTLALAWFAQASRYFLEGSSYLSSALWSACLGVVITFIISCFVTCPIWSNLLHRRPGVLIATGSVLTLCWSVAELVLGRPLP